MTNIEPPADARALIFDCDGTLADTMPNHYTAWTRALTSLGAAFPEEQFYAMGGMPTAEIIRELNRQYGYTLDVQATHDLKEKHYTDLLHTVREITAVTDIARRFRGRLPMAVASGGMGRIVDATLTALNLTSLFTAVVTQDDVVNGKPAPDVFLEAARRLGVEPEGCVVYEDGDPGIAAAAAAGMRCIDVRTVRK